MTFKIEDEVVMGRTKVIKFTFVVETRDLPQQTHRQLTPAVSA